MMLRPRPGTTAARIVQLQDQPKQVHSTNVERPIKDVCNVATRTTELADVGTQTDIEQEIEEMTVLKASVPESIEANSSEEEQSCSEPEVRGCQDQEAGEMDIQSCAWPATPIRRLQEEYIRCMGVTQKDLDLEPTVYIQEGSELLSQLRDELAILPELKDLSLNVISPKLMFEFLAGLPLQKKRSCGPF
ncbi:hypothetical protein PR003_g7957 [Phytophthora rubi]|uniref:Uncharacterized protein n=1 Tax=Phytophthora rubi TaxID=129364 RepID=A0A6A3LU24_9STRA|nr:hypothetical protein PR002_g11904 [Phytophthora rubi]KAE9039832.1 hypothetical protein PR001_g7342 [Phytophthora rubi]KAE9345400.1 hypothetical protein PR003_g7957 [Phytophthora rubi]